MNQKDDWLEKPKLDGGRSVNEYAQAVSRVEPKIKTTIDREFLNKAREKLPILCVDGVVINKKGEVLLSKRETETFKGFWHLPGGVLAKGETTEQGILRVVKGETGLETKIVQLLGVYSDPSRDPRGHFVTVGYLLEPVAGELKADHQASELKYFGQLPTKMGFDAKEICEDGVELWKEIQKKIL